MEEMNKTHEKDRAFTSQKQPETSPITMTKPVKIEEDVEYKSNVLCSTIDLNGGCKSRQHLTEAEKEARRLHRVLANRESARQTIRRRQAMFEELTRKAVDLEIENDNLKKDKELAKKEYESLKSTNDYLKAQVAGMMKSETEIGKKSEPSNSETSKPTSIPSFPCNLASVPVHWPMMAQPSDASVEQCSSESSITTPLVPLMQLWKPDPSLHQGNPAVIANPATLLCVLPFPCFFPFHVPGSAGHSLSSCMNEKQNETSAIHQDIASASSKQMLNAESSLPLEVKTEVLNSAGSTLAKDPHQVVFGLVPDGGGEREAIHQQGMVLVPAPFNCIRPVASIGPFNTLHHNDNPNAMPISSTEEDTSETISDESQEKTVQPRKKGPDTIAAADARKRRKELMKMKNLHGHQY